VVISASHNPYQDNGIKFFAEGGKKLDDALELEIEAMLEQPMSTNSSAELGRARRISGAAERYIEFCKSTFPGERDLKQLKLVVDVPMARPITSRPRSSMNWVPNWW
jgi:phosphoglucosamine mutase